MVRERASRLCAGVATCACFAFIAWGQDATCEAVFVKGTEALHANHLDEAAEAFTQCTALAPSFAEAWFNLGLVRFSQNRLDDSLTPFRTSIKLKPAMRGTHLFLGIALHRLGDETGAAKALEREVQIDPSSAPAWMWLGVVRIARGATPDAVTALEKAARLNPKDVDILYHLGRAHMLLSKEVYERMFQADPKSWRVHQVLAQALSEADRLDDAVKEAQEAIRLKGDEPGLHQQLGEIYQKQNNLDAAATEFRKELQADPRNTAVMFSLSVIEIERSQPAKAVELLAEALRRNPDSPEANYQLGRAEAQLGHNPEAAKAFAAVVANPQRLDTETVRQAYYQLSQLYRRLQRPEESRAALDAFVRLKQQADAEQNQKLENKLKKSSQERQEP